MWNRLHGTENVRRRSGQGRPCAVITTDNKYLMLTASKQNNATHLHRQFLLVTGRWLSRQVFQNKLHQEGLLNIEIEHNVIGVKYC